MNKYCATFYTHYGAIKFEKICKKLQLEAKIAPVPRKISASCTTCVFFNAGSYDFMKDNNDIDDLESCFLVDGENYTKLFADK